MWPPSERRWKESGSIRRAEFSVETWPSPGYEHSLHRLTGSLADQEIGATVAQTVQGQHGDTLSPTQHVAHVCKDDKARGQLQI